MSGDANKDSLYNMRKQQDQQAKTNPYMQLSQAELRLLCSSLGEDINDIAHSYGRIECGQYEGAQTDRQLAALVDQKSETLKLLCQAMYARARS